MFIYELKAIFNLIYSLWNNYLFLYLGGEMQRILYYNESVTILVADLV